MNPNILQRNPPLTGLVVLAFFMALLDWLWTAIPSDVPSAVSTSGYVVAAGILVWLIGNSKTGVQKFTQSIFGISWGDPNDGGDNYKPARFASERGAADIIAVCVIITLILVGLIFIKVYFP